MGGDAMPNPTPEASTPEASTGDDGSTGPDAGSCGDGVVVAPEECDDGTKNATAGDPCAGNCLWVCVAGDPKRGDTACDDGNACDGTETCSANHTCAAGTPAAAGSSCGTGKICTGGVCADAVCGDGVLTAPEECDDGANNGTSTDGCTKSCTFVCVSTDSTRNCTPADACAGKGTCNDTTHTCTPGTPLGNGTTCGGSTGDGGAADGGVSGICQGGVCTAAACGDGVLEGSEQCDWGSKNAAGAGCELDCKFSCAKSPDSCVTTDLCAGTNACATVSAPSGATGGGQMCVKGTPPANGTKCGANNAGTCQGGSCQIATCGNGTLDTGEQCDFGSGKNTAGSGCEPDCQFSCEKTPTDTCSPTDVCTASPVACTTMTGANNTPGQQCKGATHVAACGDCSASGVCVSNACAASKCGDSCVDARAGETCEPPNSATCDAQCHSIACGDGKRSTGEQCDDGNTKNLDGCDSKCKFEQDHRVNSVSINGGTDTFCTANALGNHALGGPGSLALGQLNPSLATGVKDGSTTIAFKFMNITDLTGTNANPGLQLGTLSGAPVTGTNYDGTNDVDWWYTTTASTIDSSRNPVSLLSATLSGAKLAATGTVDLAVALTGAVTTLHSTSTKIAANVGTSSKPGASTSTTPGHLASENLDPALTSFQTMSNGELCGNISASSLATVPVPAALQNSFLCGFAAYGSLLDVLVNGCGGIITATQPDQVDPAAPVVGAGAPYTFQVTSAKVTSCKDKSGTTVNLTACETAAAYSSYFAFTSDRVIMK
jgi:cysteine-rich repeat protein